jgi:hypothetical protein
MIEKKFYQKLLFMLLEHIIENYELKQKKNMKINEFHIVLLVIELFLDEK